MTAQPQFTSRATVQLLDAYEQALTKQVTALSGLVRGEAAGTYNATLQHLARGLSTVQEAGRQIAATMADPRLPADGRRQIVREHLAKAQTAVKEATDAASTAATVLRVQLREASLPAAPASRADRADAERRLESLLDRTPTKNLHNMVKQLAARDDDIASILHTQYGQDLLRLKDPQAGDALVSLVTETTIVNAKTSEDANRSRAAQALDHVGKLQAVGTALHGAMHHLGKDATSYADRSAEALSIASNRDAYAAGLAAGENRADRTGVDA